MKTLILTGAWIVSFLLNAQTIVKMNLPPQAKEALKVVVLFDEEVPGGMTVVLGVMGYRVFGGIEPFSFEWYRNGTLIGTGDIVSFVPANGDQLNLKVTDKNRCYSQSSVIMKVKSIIENEKEDVSGGISVSPTIITDNYLHISLPDAVTGLNALVRFIDLNGKVLLKSTITKSCGLQPELPAGVYFVSVQTGEFHKVEKIIVL